MIDHSSIEAFVAACDNAPQLAEMEIRSATHGVLRLRRAPRPARRGGPAVPPPPVAGEATSDSPGVILSTVLSTIVKSTLVGVFRAATAPPTDIGMSVTEGLGLGYVEVMRLSSVVPAPVIGEIIAVFVADGQPVEYGQPLFEIAETVNSEESQTIE